MTRAKEIIKSILDAFSKNRKANRIKIYRKELQSFNKKKTFLYHNNLFI